MTIANILDTPFLQIEWEMNTLPRAGRDAMSAGTLTILWYFRSASCASIMYMVSQVPIIKFVLVMAWIHINLIDMCDAVPRQLLGETSSV
eukprot:2046743-Amphidinium_carterae.1